MNWKTVWTLSVVVGLVMGVLSLFRIESAAIGWAIMLGVSFVCAILLVLKTPGRYFLHGFWTGFLFTLIETFVAAVFPDTFMRANPDFAQEYSQLPVAMHPRVFLLLAAPFAALFGGVFLGIATWIVSKILGPERPAPSSAPPPPPPAPPSEGAPPAL
jgi:hypothetical protein